MRLAPSSLVLGLAFLALTSSASAEPSTKSAIKGSGVIFKGPTKGATVAVLDEKGAKVATATTDGDGAFEVNVAPGRYRIVATKGSYVDEASGATVSLAKLEALVDWSAGAKRVSVTPFTTLALAQAEHASKGKGAAALFASYDDAKKKVDAYFGCGQAFSITDAIPVNPLNAPSAGAKNGAEVIAGLVLAALSQQAKQIADQEKRAFSSSDLVDTYADDLAADGRLDGAGAKGALKISPSRAFNGDLVREGAMSLPTALDAFATSSRNKSGVSSSAVAAQVACMKKVKAGSSLF